LAGKITQAKHNGQIIRSQAEHEKYHKLDLRDKHWSRLGPFMDNLAISLSLLAAVAALMDASELQQRGQNSKAMAKWLQATANGLMAYGFYAGKYAQKGMFNYLSEKAAGRMSTTLARFGIVLFIPAAGEFAALAGAIVSAMMIFYDLAEMLITYNRSTLFQRYDYHYKQLFKLDDRLEKFYSLEQGQLKDKFMRLGDHDGFLWNDLDFNHLTLNAVIPLLAMDYPLEQIRDMLEYDNVYLIENLTEFYERVSTPQLDDHYYQIDEEKIYFPDIAKKLANGRFFNDEDSLYQQRKQLNDRYARYNEYNDPE